MKLQFKVKPLASLHKEAVFVFFIVVAVDLAHTFVNVDAVVRLAWVGI